jgi:hypothetical protein
MRLAFHWALLPACAVTLLAGCDAKQLYLASHTVVGVNAAVNPDQTNGWLIVGYDRTFATVIPRSVTTRTADGTQTSDAMSALACSNLLVKGITIKRFTESVATGEAARKFAANLEVDSTAAGTDAKARAVKDFFDCFKDKPAPAPALDATR